MARKPTLTDVTNALEQAGRVAAQGSKAERAGQIADIVEPDVDEGQTNDTLIVYQGKGGVQVELNFASDTMWATQAQMAAIFGITQPTISRHLKHIYAEGELDLEGTYTENEYVGVNGQSRSRRLYNLDAIISVGYRVGSKAGTMFRRWATDKLAHYLVKGFVLDDERLKAPGGNNYFAELRERIRDIRASEANVYTELRSICALCSDYDPSSQAARNFYMGMQNKLLWAITSNTAPDLIISRADADKPNMGLTSWKGRDITKADTTVSKNYIAEGEAKELNRLTGMVLDFFEDQTDREQAVTMASLESRLVDFLKFNNRPILPGLGSTTRASADAHAKAEYEKFASARRLKRQAEGEAAITRLVEVDKQFKAGKGGTARKKR